MAPGTMTSPETASPSRRLLIPVIILVAILLIIIALGVGYFFSANVARPAQPTNVASAHRGDLKAAINASGKIRPKRTARLSLPLSGIISSINKMEGDEVQADRKSTRLNSSHRL